MTATIAKIDASLPLVDVRNIAAFPLAIPLMAGPGAIAATVLLAGRTNGDPVQLGILLAVVATVLALCFVMFLLAPRIATLERFSVDMGHYAYPACRK